METNISIHTPFNLGIRKIRHQLQAFTTHNQWYRDTQPLLRLQEMVQAHMGPGLEP